MAKTKISEFSSTPANNTDIDSINIAEGCAPSGINDAIRELMAQLKDWQAGTSNDPMVIGTTGSLTLNQGTANGVTYLNGSKVLTSGSGLVFDGNHMGVGVTPSAFGSGSYKAIQVGASASIMGRSGGSDAYFMANTYFDQTNYRYVASLPASRYTQGDGQHQWHSAAAGTAGNTFTFTQAMTLEAAGSLLVGTTNSPTAGALSRSTVLFKQLNDSSLTSGIQIEANANTNVLGFGYDGSTFVIGTTYRSTGGYVPISFSTSGSERARITNDGNLLVGASSQPAFFSAAAKMYVETNGADYITAFRNGNASPSGIAISYSTTPNVASNYFIDARDNTAQRFAVKSNGGIDNYSGNNTNLSDRREKTNFAPATSYLDKICAIPVQTFNYIDQNLEEDAGLTLGVVAQDVQAVAPELVMESNWASKDEEPKMRLSIYQTDLQYALMKALQELKAEFDAYKASHP